MNFPFTDVSMVAVLIAAILQMIVGMIWYNPKVFGGRWMRLVGMTDAKATGGMRRALVIAVANAILSSYAVGLVVLLAFPSSLVEALIFGVICALGFALPSHANEWGWEMRSAELIAINAGWSVVSIVMTVAVFQLLPF